MMKEEIAAQAARECNEMTARHGGGKDRPFWNPYSYQFMYVPAFQFSPLPGFKRYAYHAVDEKGQTHSFTADTADAPLTPIWADIPEGVVRLTVLALDDSGREAETVGMRTFFRLAPFSDGLPAAARPYREAAAKAFDYAMSRGFIRHWLTDGTPDPEYDLNVYPSKMISAIIGAMLYYTRACPDRAEEAITVARNAADYLIGITPREGAMKDLPPVYQLNFRPDPEKHNNAAAAGRMHWMMTIYPAHVGHAYLMLEEKTGDKKYLDEALKIAAFYRDNVQENGSWYLIYDNRTGELLSPNYCAPLERIVPFLMALYRRTGDGIWKKLADGAIAYTKKTMLSTYEWEAQFEDSSCSANYSNLTHYAATAMVRYLTRYYADDEESMKTAEEVMRFVEDQFVIWKRPSPWNRSGYDTSLFTTPCGLEQYVWHVPIDASTGDIITAFLSLYKAGRGEIYLEKAKALGNSVTRVQRADGMIPTHWMNDKVRGGAEFWLNCLFVSASALLDLAEVTEK